MELIAMENNNCIPLFSSFLFYPLSLILPRNNHCLIYFKNKPL
jgi:hypothetical protein